MSFEQKKYFESGVRYEQERIIKLLESELGAGVDLEATDFRDRVIKSLIELIKEGQK